MAYQLVPPDDQRQDLAEEAIQTWKDHSTSMLSGTADGFLLHLWCQIIPQAERQLLLLRQSHENPTFSAYIYLKGAHDYITLPFPLIGMEMLIH